MSAGCLERKRGGGDRKADGTEALRQRAREAVEMHGCGGGSDVRRCKCMMGRTSVACCLWLSVVLT